MKKRKYGRFVRRLEAEFSAEGKNYRGISSDLSRNGLFIRTNHAFAPGTIIDIVIHLPDGNSSKLRGTVRRALKTAVVSLKNGMGVELMEKDAIFENFIQSMSDISDKTVEASSPPGFEIISCPACGVKNKVLSTKIALGPKCGRCGTSLSTTIP